MPSEWSLAKEPYTSNRGNYVTEQEERFGRFGDNPQLPVTATRIEKRKNENFIGITKITMHIPGFIPYSDAWHRAIIQGQGKNPRSTFLKDSTTAN